MAYASSSRVPRESTYPLPPSATSFDFLPHLEDCINATEACASTLQGGLEKLQVGTADLPRLSKVLRNKHHYLVLPQPTVLSHKAALSTSLAPQIDSLISKAESLLEGEKGRVARLEERLSIIQSAKLPALPVQRAVHPTTFKGVEHDMEDGEPGAETGCKIEGLAMGELSAAQRRKVVMLKGKRERLEKERGRLLGLA